MCWLSQNQIMDYIFAILLLNQLYLMTACIVASLCSMEKVCLFWVLIIPYKKFSNPMKTFWFQSIDRFSEMTDIQKERSNLFLFTEHTKFSRQTNFISKYNQIFWIKLLRQIFCWLMHWIINSIWQIVYILIKSILNFRFLSKMQWHVT